MKILSRLFFVFFLVGFSLSLSQTSFAGTVVELSVVSGAAGSDPCNDGTGDFQSCLDVAESDGAANVLNVQPGTYDLNAALTYAPTNEDFPLTIQNATETLPVLDGGNTVQCLNINLNTFPGPNADVVVTGLIFQNCVNNGSNGAALAFESVDADISVGNSEFSNNSAGTNQGGAIYISIEGLGSANITASSFTDNLAQTGAGVSIELDSGSVLMADNIFDNNDANSDIGGGVLITTQGESVTVNQNVFFDNDASVGGGLFIINLNGTTSFNSNLLFNNTSTLFGGGVQISNFTNEVVITNNILFENRAGVDPTGSTVGADGGGISVALLGLSNSLTITNNTVFGNTSQEDGGGIALLMLDTDSVMNIYNNIIFGNMAANNGADLYTMEDNDGGGGGTVNLFNNDFTDFYSECLNGAVMCTGVNQGDNIDEDPAFVDETSDDFHLTADSPCVDTGDPSAPDMPSTDFDGNPRPAVVGTNPDMGALEFQPEPTPTPTPTPNPGSNLEGSGNCSFGSGTNRFGFAQCLIFAVACLIAKRRVFG